MNLINGKHYRVKRNDKWEVAKYKVAKDFSGDFRSHRLEFKDSSIMTYRGKGEPPVFTGLDEIDDDPVEG